MPKASRDEVSVLFNEPKLLKLVRARCKQTFERVSVLFNEPKLLKFGLFMRAAYDIEGFSALQRAEIAEIINPAKTLSRVEQRFSALQRAEIAEMSRAAKIKHVDKLVFQCSSTSRNC